MLLVGLTGNIASGKSEVTKLLAEHGATIIDADILAREAVKPGTEPFAGIRERWGPRVITPEGTLNRDALREIVFNNQAQLEELNQLVHPEVSRLRDEAIEEAKKRGDKIVVCSIPLLFERMLVDDFDVIILVDAPRPLRLERLMQTRGLEEAEAMKMIAAQMPAELKRARADYVIENTGSLQDLERDVEDVWKSLTINKEQKSAERSKRSVVHS